MLHPLGYNNRQGGQKTDQHRAFKLTGTHKNTCQLHFTCRGCCKKYKLLPKVLTELLFFFNQSSRKKTDSPQHILGI